MTKKEKIILIFLLALGAILRFYRFEQRLSFDWDQENFAWQAKNMIVDRRLTLIGAETSIGGIHLGPFYTYLSNLFYFFFRMDPKGGGVLSVLFGILTIGAFYFVGQKLFNKTVGFIASFLYTFSFPFILWDLVAWNLAPFHLYTLFVLFALWQSLKNERFLVVLLFLLGLGLHFHIASLVFYPLVPIAFFLFRPKFSRKFIFFSVFAFLAAVSPLILFDLRHNFHNSCQMASFFLFQASAFSLTQTTKLLPIGKIIWEEMFNFFFAGFPQNLGKIFQTLIWIFMSVLWFVGREKRKVLTILFSTVFLTLIFYSLYPGHITEYYIMPLLPIAVLLMGYCFSLLLSLRLKLVKFGLFLLFFTFLVFNFSLWWRHEKPMSLADKKGAVRFIVDDAAGQPFRISLTCASGYDTGYHYLLWYYGANLSQNLEDRIYTIVAPAGYHGIESMKEFKGVGVLWEEGQKRTH